MNAGRALHTASTLLDVIGNGLRLIVHCIKEIILLLLHPTCTIPARRSAGAKV